MRSATSLKTSEPTLNFTSTDEMEVGSDEYMASLGAHPLTKDEGLEVSKFFPSKASFARLILRFFGIKD